MITTGQYKLYYLDNIKNPVPAVGVRYQITAGNRQVARGETDANGLTGQVRILPDGSHKFRLYVYDRGLHSEDLDLAFQHDDDVYLDLPLPIPSLSGPNAPNAGNVVQVVTIKAFHRVKFHAQPGNQPLKGVTYAAYGYDRQGKLVRALDYLGNPIAGVTDAHGLTQAHYTGQPLHFQFTKDKQINERSPLLQPLYKGLTTFEHAVPLKTIQSVTGPKGTEVPLAGKTSLPIMLDADGEELIMVPQHVWDQFEAVSGLLENTVAATHRARADLNDALESKSKPQIGAAEKALGQAEERVKEMLNKDFKQVADLKEVTVFEKYSGTPTAAPASGSPAGTVNVRRRYTTKEMWQEFKSARVNKKEYKVKIKNGKNSATISPKEFNRQAFKDSLLKIAAETKEEIKSDPLVLGIDGISGEFGNAVKHSETFETETASQWLRFVGGAGASGAIQWKDAKLALQGNLQGKLVLYEHKYVMRWSFPSRLGWMMCLAEEDLGALRFVMQIELYGFIGAKAGVEGALNITIDRDGKQKITPTPRPQNANYSQNIDPNTGLPRFDASATLNETKPEDKNGLKVDASAFAGGEGSLTGTGMVQWLAPEQPDFSSFAELSGTVGASFGIGAKGALAIYYDEGRVRFKVAAHLCYGLGAKGAVEFTVDAKHMLEFTKWLSFQLLHAGFKKLVMIEEEAFNALAKISFMVIAEVSNFSDDKEGIKQLEAKLQKTTTEVNDAFDVTLSAFNDARRLSQIINNVRSADGQKDPSGRGAWVKYATPETRGMFIFHIMRAAGFFDHTRNPPTTILTNRHGERDLQVSYLDEHKLAILVLLKTVNTVDQWTNVIQHMTEKGTKDATRPIGHKEGDILRFFNNGISLAPSITILLTSVTAMKSRGPGGPKPNNKTGNDRIDEYLNLREALLGDFPKGYDVAVNGSDKFWNYVPYDGQTMPIFARSEPGPLDRFFEDSGQQSGVA